MSLGDLLVSENFAVQDPWGLLCVGGLLLTRSDRCFGDKGDVEDITEGISSHVIAMVISKDCSRFR